MSPQRSLATVFLASVPLCACASGTSSVPAPPSNLTPGNTTIHVSELDESTLRATMRDAFEDEAQWSRLYIVHAYGKSSDTGVITTRLMSAEDAIATAVRPLYGDAFADSLATLLHERANGLIGLVSQQVIAPVGGNLRAGWLAKSDEIAALIASATPAIVQADLDAELHASAQATLDQIDAYARQDWVADEAAYETAVGHELATADLYTSALVSQFHVRPSVLGARAEQITFTLRTLVDDAALWTRILLVAHETGSSELPYAADGAVNAANAVGTVFSSFYGIDVGTEVGRQVHLVMITDGFAYSFAAESGDTATAGTLYAKWLTDADAFAAYLAPLVSETSTGSLERLLHVYVTETGAEINARVASDWQGDVDAFDAAIGETRALSSLVGSGLAESSPPAAFAAPAVMR